jgi:hypothetical protein
VSQGRCYTLGEAKAALLTAVLRKLVTANINRLAPTGRRDGMDPPLDEVQLSYRFPARLSRELLLRQENQPKPIRDVAWKGQLRLCARYRRLGRTGKPANVVTTAIARELAGFLWAIARHVMAEG